MSFIAINISSIDQPIEKSIKEMDPRAGREISSGVGTEAFTYSGKREIRLVPQHSSLNSLAVLDATHTT